MTYLVIAAADRAVTSTDWLTSRHGFSFGDHYDPARTHHGSLLVHNAELVTPGQGFDRHPHRETEIVTWVIRGSLVHQDTAGHSGVVHPGLAQRMSAGTGIEHSERNDRPGDGPVSYVQMWLMPDETGIAPSYAQHDISGELRPGRLVPVASGNPAQDSAIRIANRGATLYAARLRLGDRIELPTGRYTHLYVTTGAVRAGDVPLTAGDTLEGTDLAGWTVHGDDAVGDDAAGDDAGSEILVWAMEHDLRDLF